MAIATTANTTTAVASPIKSEPRRPPRHRRRPPNGADTKSDSATLANTMRKPSTTPNAALLVLTLRGPCHLQRYGEDEEGFSMDGLCADTGLDFRAARGALSPARLQLSIQGTFLLQSGTGAFAAGILLACSLMPGLALVATLILGITSDTAPRAECEGALSSILSFHRALLPSSLLGKMLWSLRSFAAGERDPSSARVLRASQQNGRRVSRHADVAPRSSRRVRIRGERRPLLVDGLSRPVACGCVRALDTDSARCGEQRRAFFASVAVLMASRLGFDFR
ncbi:hypothetical protein K438DRAFT_444520 [Mycena galopus ATCC 62051]|nr:hypothetical protein K438DRAFT_444520 [Mycena galopus ATCC 62051]